MDKVMTENTEHPDNELHDAGNSTPQQSNDPKNEIDHLQAENAELKDRYLRAMAEMENQRRRAERDKADTIKYSLEKVMAELLPVIDVFESALQGTARQSHSDDQSNSLQAFVSGTELVYKQLIAALTKHGLERLQSEGQPFDPNKHQAIQRIEDESVTEETVSQVFAEGYLIHGRLLRPAMVAVSVPKS